MNYLKNHCWCSDSNWGGGYDCQIIVSLRSYGDGYEADWKNLTHSERVFSQEKYDSFVEHLKDKGADLEDEKVKARLKKNIGYSFVQNFNPEVLEWLEENVPDVDGEKGWCVGSPNYRAQGSSCSLQVFFQRTRPAMAFIKKFSKHKKPINYCQYFTDVRKTLDLETGKYGD